LTLAEPFLTTLFLVRNRSKEIVELLSDVEKIRAERRKAKANKTKYTGVGSEGWGPTSTGTRYGGFGSDSFSSGGGGGGGGYGGGGSYDADDDGGYSGNGSYSGDGGYSGGSYSGGGNSKRFQEYDAGDDETPRRSSLSNSDARPSTSQQKGKSALSKNTTVPTKAPEKPPVQEVDLLGFADDEAFGSGPTILSPPISAPGFAPPQPTKPAASLEGMLSLVAGDRGFG
jgi:epsin